MFDSIVWSTFFFAEIRTPVCAVTGAQYLTGNGWSELRNPIDTDYPFRMFRDEGRTFLQVSLAPEAVSFLFVIYEELK